MGQDVTDEERKERGPDPRASDPLWVQRVILCDLLIGRWMRFNAEKILRRGLELEKLAQMERFSDGWQVCVDQEVDAAAGMERMGVLSEQGLIAWGGRISRQGYNPEDD